MNTSPKQRGAHQRHLHGFTIVDLVIVIAVIAILTTITAVSYRAVLDNNRTETVKLDARTAGSVAEKYHADHAQYATDSAQLDLADTSSTINYTAASDGSGFCVSATLEETVWHVKSGNTEPKEGVCPSI